MEARDLAVMGGSFVGFQLLFFLGSPLLSAFITPSYRRLAPGKLTEWNSRMVSTIHAFVVGLFCLYILWFDDAVNADPVWGDPTLVKLNVAITCGYLLYDLALLACNWSTMGDGFFVCHHVAALYAYSYVLVGRVELFRRGGRTRRRLAGPYSLWNDVWALVTVSESLTQSPSPKECEPICAAATSCSSL
uniref:TLC domain containing 4b n=1 Tax=Scleropages formosus TaxID=113540 RepID=A0A8C9SZT3_SCLFO